MAALVPFDGAANIDQVQIVNDALNRLARLIGKQMAKEQFTRERELEPRPKHDHRSH